MVASEESSKFSRWESSVMEVVLKDQQEEMEAEKPTESSLQQSRWEVLRAGLQEVTHSFIQSRLTNL